MRSIFLSPDEVFVQQISLLDTVGAAAPAADLALLTAADDGFLVDGVCINYYLSDGSCVNRFGREDNGLECAVRPVLMLDEGEEQLLSRRQQDGSVVTVEYGRFPYAVLDGSLRELAEREYARGVLPKSGKLLHIAG